VEVNGKFYGLAVLPLGKEIPDLNISLFCDIMQRILAVVGRRFFELLRNISGERKHLLSRGGSQKSRRALHRVGWSGHFGE
jgi:hypothetical protein